VSRTVLPMLAVLLVIFVLVPLLTSAATADAATMAQSTAPVAASPSAGVSIAPFDVKAAVDAYLAKVPPDQRARSDAYFEGGYWLILWDFVATVVAMWLMLRFRWSTAMRDLADRMTRFRPLQTAIYSVQFIVLYTLLTFPMAVYEGYFREHQYGLSNQTFVAWLRDQAVGLAISIVLGAVLLMVLFGLVRRLGKSWWVWGAVAFIAFTVFAVLIAPVYISPLFNKYTKLEDPKIKAPILSMARANGIPATDVYVFDESRQSKRVSANVSGLAGTTRISLNDNLLNRCTLPEIEATMGHEMGHYVMNHQYKGLLALSVLAVIGFAFVNWGLNVCLRRWGGKWGISDIGDVAVLPLAVLLISFYGFLLTPVTNTISRTMEYEADMFGLNASQQPDGGAEVDLMLGEYRKLDPGPIEEFIFYDHPSGRTRITAAMRWKAEHLPGAAAPSGPTQP